jgi:hypothetical protein
LILLPKETPILTYYKQEIINGSSSHGTNRMIEKIVTFKKFLEEGLLPQGFIERGRSSFIENSSNKNLPFYYVDNEVFLYDMIFQIGIFMTLLWIYIIWYRLFSFKNGVMFKNQYKTLLFMSTFSLIHTSSLNYLFIFISVMYFSESSKLSKNVLINK